MDLISSKYKLIRNVFLEETEDNDDPYITKVSFISYLQKKQSEKVYILTKLNKVNEDIVNNLCEAQDEFFTTFKQEHRHKPCRKLIFIYDMRTTIYSEYSKAIKPFISMHYKNEHDYQKYLHSTAIVFYSQMITNIISTLLSTVYIPIRPVEMIYKEDDPKVKISNLFNLYD